LQKMIIGEGQDVHFLKLVYHHAQRDPRLSLLAKVGPRHRRVRHHVARGNRAHHQPPFILVKFPLENVLHMLEKSLLRHQHDLFRIGIQLLGYHRLSPTIRGRPQLVKGVPAHRAQHTPANLLLVLIHGSARQIPMFEIERCNFSLSRLIELFDMLLLLPNLQHLYLL
jgi:hypothetical protein